FTQGWIEGQQLSGGVHEFFNGDLEIYVRFHDGAGFPTDRVILAERYYCCAVPTPALNPAPLGLAVPKGCGIYAHREGIRTGQNGETIHWIATCPSMGGPDLAIAFSANIEQQGWLRED